MTWLGLDVGGANLKLSDARDMAVSRYFPLWRRPGELAAELGRLLAPGKSSIPLAVTMTGELADCFGSKREGVLHILDAVAAAAGQRRLLVYLTDGCLVPVSEARQRAREAAAANWHALARFAGRFAASGPALLMDVGSTTADFIPLIDGRPVPRGFTDTDRLVAGELVYSGVHRSPVCALVAEAPFRDQMCPVAQEVFATTLDVYLTLGDVAPNERDHATADGRPATQHAARARLARCLCADPGEFTPVDARHVAQAVAQAQLALLEASLRRVVHRLPDPPRSIVASGGGEFLAARVADRLAPSARRVSLAGELGAAATICATAHALAVLASEDHKGA